jgi:hypothetical protein
VSPNPHLGTERVPVSETLCSLFFRIPDHEQVQEPSVILHRQNALESTETSFCIGEVGTFLKAESDRPRDTLWWDR